MIVPKAKKLKSGTWFIYLRLGGEGVSITGGTEKECVHKAELAKAQYLVDRKKQDRKPRQKKSALTLRQAVDKYIAVKKTSLSPSTIRNYRLIQNNRFQDYMDKPIDSIKDWQEVYNSEVGKIKPKTLKNAFGLIKSVYLYTYGVPMPRVETQPVPKVDRPFLDAEQIKLFLKAVKGDTCEIPALLALSSLRCSEILALRWENVDLKKKTILVSGALVRDEDGKMINKATNKTDASHRYVPIFIPQLYDALKAVDEKQGRVADISPHGLYAAINRVCDKAGLPHTGVHGLRHSFASLAAVHLKLPEETTMAIGGWSDFTTMRKIYTHVSQRDMNEQTKMVEQFFKNANSKMQTENSH